MEKIKWERAAAIVICIGAALLCLRLFFRYAIGIAMPFFMAYLLSCILRPILDRMMGSRHPRRGKGEKIDDPSRGRRLLSAILVLLVTGGTGWLIVAAARRGFAELQELLLRLGESPGKEESSLSHIMDYIQSISSHLPFLRRLSAAPGYSHFCTWLDGAVRAAAAGLMEQLSDLLSAGAVSLVGSLPSVFLFCTVFLLSCYYFTAEPGILSRLLLSRLSPALRERIRHWQTGAGQSLRRYLRACLLMALLTFGEMFIGFSLLRQPYPLLLALFTAAVDFLPVLGTGTVLIPWGVLQLLMGHTGTGLGLLILYAVSAILREILEPHIVGRSLGVHPLLSLLAVYAGARLFGVAGMICAPIVLAMVIHVERDPEGRSSA